MRPFANIATGSGANGPNLDPPGADGDGQDWDWVLVFGRYSALS